MNDGERLVAKDSLADLEAREGDGGIDPADIIGPAHADVGFIRFHGQEKGAHAERGRAQFLDDGIELFDGLAGLIGIEVFAGKGADLAGGFTTCAILAKPALAGAWEVTTGAETFLTSFLRGGFLAIAAKKLACQAGG